MVRSAFCGGGIVIGPCASCDALIDVSYTGNQDAQGRLFTGLSAQTVSATLVETCAGTVTSIEWSVDGGPWSAQDSWDPTEFHSAQDPLYGEHTIDVRFLLDGQLCEGTVAPAVIEFTPSLRVDNATGLFMLQNGVFYGNGSNISAGTAYATDLNDPNLGQPVPAGSQAAPNVIGVIGSSITLEHVTGYLDVSQRDLLWPISRPDYDGGGLHAWHEQIGDPGSVLWGHLSDFLVSHPPTHFWIQVCTRVDVNPDLPTMQTQLTEVLAELDSIAGVLPRFISSQPRYNPGTNCTTVTNTEIAVAEQLVDWAVDQGMALRGPVTGPLDLVHLLDACHLNDTDGEPFVGTQMANFFDSGIMDTVLANHNGEPYAGRFINLTSGEGSGFDTGGVANIAFYKGDLGLNGFRVSCLYHSEEPLAGDALTWASNNRQNPLGDMVITSLKEGLVNTYTLHEPAPGSQLDDTTKQWAKDWITRVWKPIIEQVDAEIPEIADRLMFSPTNEPGRSRGGTNPSFPLTGDPDHPCNNVYTGLPFDGLVAPLTALDWRLWIEEMFDYLLDEVPTYWGLLVAPLPWFGLGLDGPGDILDNGVLQDDLETEIDYLVSKYGPRLVIDRHAYSRHTPQKAASPIPTPTSDLIATSGISFDDIGDLYVNTRGAGLLVGEIFSKRLPQVFYDAIGKVTHAPGEGPTNRTDYLAAMIYLAQLDKTRHAFTAPWFGGGELGAQWWFGDNGHEDSTQGGIPVPWGAHGSHPANNMSWQADLGDPDPGFTMDMVAQYQAMFDNGPAVVAPSGNTDTGLDDGGWIAHLLWRYNIALFQAKYVDLCEVWYRLAWMRSVHWSTWQTTYSMSVSEHPRSQPHLVNGDTAQFRCVPTLGGASLQWQRSYAVPLTRISKDVGGWVNVGGATGQTYSFAYDGVPTFVRCRITAPNLETSFTHPAIAGDY